MIFKGKSSKDFAPLIMFGLVSFITVSVYFLSKDMPSGPVYAQSESVLGANIEPTQSPTPFVSPTPQVSTRPTLRATSRPIIQISTPSPVVTNDEGNYDDGNNDDDGTPEPQPIITPVPNTPAPTLAPTIIPSTPQPTTSPIPATPIPTVSPTTQPSNTPSPTDTGLLNLIIQIPINLPLL